MIDSRHYGTYGKRETRKNDVTKYQKLNRVDQASETENDGGKLPTIKIYVELQRKYDKSNVNSL